MLIKNHILLNIQLNVFWEVVFFSQRVKGSLDAISFAFSFSSVTKSGDYLKNFHFKQRARW
ncbi:hypothetical protein SAMN05421807_111131 [Virgibacillus chiguensis]|uniref:Uncharacterized protein n=1 Tax=Virgibacillus chiguensis TaxID=411959 RepID=A0A1M5V5W9_9BACI|nr:hypothetical protein SAMN05421807_111131 [Virgibacillus chiguensis]